MSTIKQGYGEGKLADKSNGGADDPPLDEVLRGVADDLAEMDTALTPGWSASRTVTSHTVTLPDPGVVVAVHATAGTAAGPKQQISTGTPAAGQVRVTYSAGGVPTLLFNTTDAITACVVTQLVRTADSIESLQTLKG